MYKNLRIIFTILSTICLAAAIPLGIIFDFVGIIGALLGAGIFFVLMLLCKQSQEFAEAKQKKSSSSSLAHKDEDNDAKKTNLIENADVTKNNLSKQKTLCKKVYKYKRNKK